jgi:gas vesicle protein
MFSRVRVAIRFFFVGLAVGVLLAPRSGIETRQLLRQRADRLLNDLLDAASLGALEGSRSGTGSGNGSRSSRKTTARQAEASAAGSAAD